MRIWWFIRSSGALNSRYACIFNSFNENNNIGEPLQWVLDFTDDVAEREALESLPSLTV